METAQLAKLLTAVQEGRLSVAEAVAQWPDQAGGAPDFAVLDHGRTGGHTGMPEVVFCQGKTPAQVVTIVADSGQRGPRPGDARLRRDW